MQPKSANVVLTLGADEALGADYLFGAVGSVASDQFGRIYVADQSDSRIRVYSSAGVFLGSVGREGEGPGEFQVPFDLLFSGQDLWVRDLTRIQQLRPRASGGVPDSIVRTHRLGNYANTSSRRSRLVADSLYYSPGYFYPLTGGASYFYEAIAPSGVVDTLFLPEPVAVTRRADATYRGGRLGREDRDIIGALGLAPFESRTHWDLTPQGTLVAGSGEDPVLVEVDSEGLVVRTYPLPLRRRAVPSEARRDSTDALNTRLSALSVRLEDIENVSTFIRSDELPDSLPTSVAVHVAADGRIWAEVWPSAEGSTEFVVFEAGGDLAGYYRIPVVLSPTVPPHFSGGQIVGVAVSPVTGVDQVIVATAQED